NTNRKESDMFVEGGIQEVGTIQSLVAWLETKNSKEAYKYIDPHNCLLAQYYTAVGYDKIAMGSTEFSGDNCGEKIRVRLPANFDKIARRSNQTFGGALRMARKYLPENYGKKRKFLDWIFTFTPIHIF